MSENNNNTMSSMLDSLEILAESPDDGKIVLAFGDLPQQLDTWLDDAESTLSEVDTTLGDLTELREDMARAVEAAGDAKDDAETQAANAEAWAVGTRGGTDVSTEDETYHNNSKYYAEQTSTGVAAAAASASAAATSAGAAAGSASDAASSANESAVSAAAASASATAASSSQTSAASSATAAAASQTAAAASETSASNSAASASSSATSASGSATAAAASASAAAQSAQDAEDVLDSIPPDYTTTVQEVSALKSALSDTASGINDMLLKTSDLVLNVKSWSEAYTPTTPTYKISQIAVIDVSPNVAYKFVWQAITTWRNENAIRFTLMNGETVITNYLFSADAKECEILTSANTNRIKIEAVITTNTRPSTNGVYEVFNLLGYVGNLVLNDRIDVQTSENVSDKIQGTLKALLNDAKIVYEESLISTPYTKQTGTYKSTQIGRFNVNPNTVYTWVRGFTHGGIADRDINIALYASNDVKITDIPFMTANLNGTFTTNANTSYVVVSHVLSLASAPSNNGYVTSGNIVIAEGLMAFDAIMDVAKQSEFEPVATAVDDLREDMNKIIVMPSVGDALNYRRLDQIIISTTYHDLRPSGNVGISETYAFDVSGVTTPVTIVIKNNNTIALAYSDVPMASINSGDAVTPLYAYTLINGEITVPAHVFNGHSTLLVSPTYKAAKRSLCKCVKGTTDSYKRRPPIISFIDDDGMDEALDNWEALGNSLGIRNSFAIITGSVGQGNYANWEKIQRLSGEGFEFVSHTHGHQDVTALTDEAINADSKLSREAMIAHGLPYKFLAYPGGYIDSAHYAIIQKNYMAGIAGGGSALNVPPLNPINIVRSSIVSGTKQITVDGTTYTVNTPKTIDAIKTEFDTLIMKRGWIVFTSHFRNSYTDGYYYDDDFSTLVEDIAKYAQANGVAIKSFSKGFEMFNNRLAIGNTDDANYYIVDCDGIVHER